ncbi:hypothetical protein SETIT_9G366100v2 [Setaria italica]|uniref:Uncharacterized protein n=2 Tax=Setaria TaxID=4554 RepID=A0A368SPI7_SETIT|nr:hypothetical protein SETIT_9G366100v2 [Setaria italica]TKV95565.1 hypothetical protein SEVIR_9G371800v2 [Setaria viridis]
MPCLRWGCTREGTSGGAAEASHVRRPRRREVLESSNRVVLVRHTAARALLLFHKLPEDRQRVVHEGAALVLVDFTAVGFAHSIEVLVLLPHRGFSHRGP